VRLDGRQFSYLTVMSDKLVPVARADAEGKPLFALAQALLPGASPVPYLAFHSMALGRLAEDHLASHPLWPRLRRCIECDSADANYEYVLKGLGVAWMPGPWCSATAGTVVWRWPGTAVWTCISMCGFIGPNAA
jgi:DNA-binding transcriptional LysR family regulator